MKISEKTHQNLFNSFLVLIAITMIFRQVCTSVIIAFAVYNLIFYKKLNYNSHSIILGVIIASPFILEIIMFWNNDSFSLAIKALEKTTSLLLFPLFILGNYKKINTITILRLYSLITTFLMFFVFIRFVIIYPEYINKYMNGIHLWESGYVFSNSIGMHAPALNLHIAFVAICNFYFFLNLENKTNSFLKKLSMAVLFLISFFIVLFINTRMSMLCMLLGFLIVLYFQFFQNKNFQKNIKRSALILSLSTIIFLIFVQKDTFLKEKFTTQIFSNIDKVGKLDEIDHPEIVVYSSLVTRLSIWKSCWELSVKNLPFGVGSSDGKNSLVKYFKDTNQVFLAKYEFPTHNQYLDFLLRFGVLGVIVILLYMFTFGYLGLKFKNPLLLSFFFLFFLSNLTDDFLIRFDGIAFSGFWFSIFAAYILRKINQESLKNEALKIQHY